ncbi:hypothetical protein BAUCODRAFT_39071 [Baudoinia panamericana UAMH 10762]|uniref:Uncharacterized protein n=1 Tax=Baudoinia panamericana (strain UAMH 10762) TaxID=717646 RepID=M2M5L6_BAUPA|nr:uncharacterized protein BAUCODRAFT_39071 [Baudoinia panamericana UAMH 10762]EMC91926.1 hypothetical protein BAUCODRAFT_39071 [Baudoinia panamericana UAMH 10762]
MYFPEGTASIHLTHRSYDSGFMLIPICPAPYGKRRPRAALFAFSGLWSSQEHQVSASGSIY